MNALYTAEALSSGADRNGHVRTASGTGELNLAIAKAKGGSGIGANPEELIAAGIAACFHSAWQMVEGNQKVTMPDTSVGSRVKLLPNGEGAFVSAVELEVALPWLTTTAHHNEPGKISAATF